MRDYVVVAERLAKAEGQEVMNRLRDELEAAKKKPGGAGGDNKREPPGAFPTPKKCAKVPDNDGVWIVAENRDGLTFGSESLARRQQFWEIGDWSAETPARRSWSSLSRPRR